MLIVVAITVQHFQKLCKFQVICETVSVSPSHPEQPSIKRQLKGAPKAKGRSSAIRAKFSSAIGRRNNLDKIAHAKKGCSQCICPNSPVVHADSEWNTYKCHFLSYIQNMWHCLRTNDVYYNNCQGQVLGLHGSFWEVFLQMSTATVSQGRSSSQTWLWSFKPFRKHHLLTGWMIQESLNWKTWILFSMQIVSNAIRLIIR